MSETTQVLVKVTVFDTVTEEIRLDGTRDAYAWTEGNWSCDCNREILFGRDSHDGRAGYCLGCKRYLVIHVDGSDLSLDDFNSDYPVELKRKHGLFRRSGMREFSLSRCLRDEGFCPGLDAGPGLATRGWMTWEGEHPEDSGVVVIWVKDADGHLAYFDEVKNDWCDD